MTLSLQLPAEAQALLKRRATHQGTSEDDLAARLLTRLLTDEEAEFRESVAAIGRGFADADAGRTVAFEQFIAGAADARARRRARASSSAEEAA